MTPRRSALLVSALCVAAVAAALGATRYVEARSPGLLMGAAPEFRPLPLRRFDVHQRVTPGTVADAVRIAEANGIDGFVNLSGGHLGGGLEESLEAARPFGRRVIVFMELDLEGCCGAGWSAREVDRLARGKALGARGLHAFEPTEDGPAGAPALDAPQLDPIWSACARLALPVAIAAEGPAWLRLVEHNPDVRFIASRFGGSERDPGAAAALLERLPNLVLDTAGAVPELGLGAEAARRAILAHPERVLLGTGLQYLQGDGYKALVYGAGPPGGSEAMRRFFEGIYRFYETRDAEIPSPTPAQGRAPLAGMGLPRDALDKLYHRNAESLLGLGDRWAP